MADFMIQRTFTGETAVKDTAAFMAAVDVLCGQVEVPARADGVWNFGSLPIRLAEAMPIDEMALRSVVIAAKRLTPLSGSSIKVKALITDRNGPVVDPELDAVIGHRITAEHIQEL
jgi:hypothetical protein